MPIDPVRRPSTPPSPTPSNSAHADTSAPSRTAPATPEWKQDVYVSASTVQNLAEDLSSLGRRVGSFTGITKTPWLLREMGPLGMFGPIGAFGPLSEFGPIGKNGEHPSHWVSGSFAWNDFRDYLTAHGGPLSANGPLSERGPLGSAHDSGLRAAMGSSWHQFTPGGVFGVLGPEGPLGALGPLGPLGPVGAHGFIAPAEGGGEYRDDTGNVHRTIDVPWNARETRTYELFENYTEAKARGMRDNDTSFMVEGRTTKPGDSDTFKLTNNQDQVVTFAVVPTRSTFSAQEGLSRATSAALDVANPFLAPFGRQLHARSDVNFEKDFDNFDLEVLDKDGNVLAKSNIKDGVDWLQLRVPPGTELQARVTTKSSLGEGDQTYRLMVVGSGEFHNEMETQGDHLKKLGWDE